MKEKKQHNHGKHMILMLLCCLIPIILFGAVRYFNLGSNGLGRYSSLLFLLCPLMHVFMMGGMMGKGKQSCHEEKVEERKINEDNI
jgi:hypothetical protein